MRYATIPTQFQWQSDCLDPNGTALVNTFTLFGIGRQHHQQIQTALRNDVIMTRIGELLLMHATRVSDAGQQNWLLADMYMVCVHWLRTEHSQRPTPRRHSLSTVNQYIATFQGIREAAVTALMERVCLTLCARFSTKDRKVTINVLPRYLELYFGKVLTAHGLSQDIHKQYAKYMERADIEKYRVILAEGMAHMLPWWMPSGGPGVDEDRGIVLADTRHAYEETGGKEEWLDVNEAGFVMSIGRQIYVAPHVGPHPVNYTTDFTAIYHSSYLAGGAVLMAGALVIEDGVFKKISSKSGHYQPPPTNILHVLNLLAMHGMLRDDIVIEVVLPDAPPVVCDTVGKFRVWLAKSGTFEERAQDILKANIDDDDTKQRWWHGLGYRGKRIGGRHI